MKYILGKKLSMSQVFDNEGVVHPVTIVEAGPVTVTQVKEMAKDGYKAVQVAFGARKEKNVNKAQKSQWKDLGTFAYVREFRLAEGDETPAVGSKIEAGVFAAGDSVAVSGISKGKGFQGVVKRHGFKGGRRSHGQKHSEREAGSIGGGGRAGGRVAKGMRMAGRMGGDRVTVKNLRVVAVDSAQNQLLISGAIPGRRGTLVEIRG